MGYLDTCYRSKMRLFPDRPDILVEGEWCWSPPGAKRVPFPHAFYPSVWDEDTVDYDGVGEVREDYRRIIKGKSIPGLTGQTPCGSAEDWLHGTPYAERGKLPLDQEGRCQCCVGPGPPGGGDSDFGCGETSGGWTQFTEGEDADGAAAVQYADGIQAGSGEDADEGSSVQFADGMQSSSGGDEEEGAGTQVRNDSEAGSGGDEDEGASQQYADGSQTGSGGDEEEGSGSQIRNDSEAGSGGDEDEGASEQYADGSQTGSGGDEDEGSGSQEDSIPQDAEGGDEDQGDGTQETDVALTGEIVMYAVGGTPTGYLACDGSAVSRTTYSGLFAVLGTTYGVGDGTTTFNLPDFRSRVPIAAGTGSGLTARATGGAGGGESVTLSTSQLPSHSHGGDSGNNFLMFGSGNGQAVTGVGSPFYFAANTGAAGGGSPVPIMPPWLAVQFLIKT